MSNLSIRLRVQAITLSAAASLALHAAPATAQHYVRANLTSDQSAVASHIDTHLVNPWGMSRGGGSPWWISDNGTGVATIYDAVGAAQPLVVIIPPGDPTRNSTGNPTGTVFNGGTGFELAPGKPAFFLFVTEDGTVSGWNPGVAASKAVIKVNTKGASIFKGAALATVPNGSGGRTSFLYATDFLQGKVQVWDQAFHRVVLSAGQFEDAQLPAGYAPFNIQNIGGELYVTFAAQDSDKHDEVDGAGLGRVDVFSTSGQLLRRLDHGSWLNAPWGLAMASGDFGIFSHDLLVGQFGSGTIAVYDPVTGHFKGLLQNSANTAITIPGLWGLSFGSGTASGAANSLYFTAGADHEAHGLFGNIKAVENTGGNSN